MADSNAFTAETAQQHQAELNDYLQSKSINQLFIQIVEALLIEKPDNPIGFTVQFLQKKFPEQAAVAGPPADVSAIAVAATASAPTAPQAAEEKDGDNSESDEEDEDDYVDDMVFVDKYSKTSGKAKRNSVFSAGAPSMSASEVPIIKKTPEVIEGIIATLKQQTLFAHFEQEQLETLAGAMDKKVFDGETIIKEGDPEGDFFYVVDSGIVDCYKGQEKVFTYEGKGAFGELAIMYNAPRAATCKARGKVECWSLQRDHFKVLIMQSTIDKRNKYTEFIKKVDMLKQLNEYELMTMADALREEVFEPGARVCRQGDPGNDFYIVKQGVAVCTQTQSSGEEQEVAQIGVGSYFGEIALLTSKPRQATVSAGDDQPLVVLSLDRKTFTRVMGPMEEILKRNMEAYNKIKSASI